MESASAPATWPDENPQAVPKGADAVPSKPALPMCPAGRQSSGRDLLSKTSDVANTALAAVASAAALITQRDIAELRSFRHPPAAVCQVVEAAASIVGVHETRWVAIRKLLDTSFLQRIRTWEPTQMPRAEKLRRLLQSPVFRDAPLREMCPAAAPMAAWCSAVGRCLAAKAARRPSSPDDEAAGTEVVGRPSRTGRPSPGTSREPSLEPREEPSARVTARPASAPPSASLAAHRAQQVAAQSRRGVAGDLAEKRLTEESPPKARGAAPPAPPELGGLSVEPPLWALSDAELAHVQELRIGREEVGQVTFHGETDCRGLLPRLPQLISIENGEVVVYPDPQTKPSVGVELNKPASVMLYCCMPKSQGRLNSEEARERYKRRVAQMTEEKGAHFVDYDCGTGTWEFRVDNFC